MYLLIWEKTPLNRNLKPKWETKKKKKEREREREINGEGKREQENEIKIKIVKIAFYDKFSISFEKTSIFLEWQFLMTVTMPKEPLFGLEL